VKVKLSLCALCRLKREWRHLFLTSSLGGVGGERSASHPGHFSPGEQSKGSLWIGGWVRTRAGLEALENRKFSCTWWESNQNSTVNSSCNKLASINVRRYTPNMTLCYAIVLSCIGSDWNFTVCGGQLEDWNRKLESRVRHAPFLLFYPVCIDLDRSVYDPANGVLRASALYGYRVWDQRVNPTKTEEEIIRYSVAKSSICPLPFVLIRNRSWLRSVTVRLRVAYRFVFG